MEKITSILNRFPFIKWDRFIGKLEQGTGDVYGWIERKDGKSDFVLFTFIDYVAATWITSSSKYTRDIDRIFCDLGGFETQHEDCMRVEDYFMGVVNKTTLD